MSLLAMFWRRIFAADPDTPTRRVLPVEAESRTLPVEAESRVLAVEAGR